MVYQIYYKDRENILFDIEIYVTENKDGVWYLEIIPDSKLSGGMNFILDFNNKVHGNIQELLKDIKEIENLREWLWEKTDNTPVPFDEIDKKAEPKYAFVDEKIKWFAGKYKLRVNVD